jgi:murein DD-endopeptidase MepM/ murein hydrolase activator NlpD
MPGIYHRVERGETLWRIAKTYNVDLEKIVKINRIPDAARINSGQLIFIPDAKEKRRVVTYEELKKGEDTFIWPLKEKVISYYGAKKGNIKNKGIDIRTREGAKVVASRSGRVSFCDEKVKGYGKTIIIQHGDGYSTVYAHNSQILVKLGQWVKQGEVIARAGSTGRTSIPILHFEIRKKHQPQNPFYYLP